MGKSVLRISVLFLIAIVSVLITSCDDAGTGMLNPGGNNGSNALVAIQVTPVSNTLPLASSHQYTATGIYQNNTTADITNSVHWSSNAPSIATVNSTGLVTTVSSGSAIISANLNGVVGTSALTVSSATLQSISISAAHSSIAIGTTTQLIATGTYSDNTTLDITSQVQWSSSESSIATVSIYGLADGLAAGTTQITATLSGIDSNALPFTVNNIALTSLQITPSATESIANGTALNFTATGIFADGSTQNLTNQVTWNSSNSGLLSIESSGLATAATSGTGSATVTATYNSESSNTVTINVVAATLTRIQVTPSNITSLEVGLAQQYTALGIYSNGTTQNLTNQVVWNSSSQAVSIGVHSGYLIAESVSSSLITITATYGSGNTQESGIATIQSISSASLTSIVVTPSNASIATGTTQQYNAMGVYSDGAHHNLTSQATWSITNAGSANATISNESGTWGVVSAGTVPGSATIKAIFNSIQSHSVSLVIESKTLTSLQITPESATLASGTTGQYSAIAIYSDGSSQNITDSVIWSSSESTIATISNTSPQQGLVTTVGSGSTVISATYNTMVESTPLTVTGAALESIVITPSESVSVMIGSPGVQLTATGNFESGNPQNLTNSVTWAIESSSTGECAITNATAYTDGGLLTGESIGTCVVTATSGAITSLPVTVTVFTTSALESLVILPTNPIINTTASTVQLQLIGIYSNGRRQNLTSQATWSQVGTSSASGVFATTPIIESGVNAGLVTAESILVTGNGTFAASYTPNGESTLTATTGVYVGQYLAPYPAVESIESSSPCLIDTIHGEIWYGDGSQSGTWTNWCSSTGTAANSNCSQDGESLVAFNSSAHCGLIGGWHLPTAPGANFNNLPVNQVGGDWGNLGSIAADNGWQANSDFGLWLSNNGFSNVIYYGFSSSYWTASSPDSYYVCDLQMLNGWTSCLGAFTDVAYIILAHDAAQ